MIPNTASKAQNFLFTHQVVTIIAPELEEKKCRAFYIQCNQPSLLSPHPHLHTPSLQGMER